MKILRTRSDVFKYKKSLKAKTIGFVPTMGALHSGHLSLVRASKKKCDLTLASVFVNPTQFGANEDFDRYPRVENEDLQLLKAEKIDAVFIPKSSAEIYPMGETAFQILPPSDLHPILEGQSRPGHFS